MHAAGGVSHNSRFRVHDSLVALREEKSDHWENSRSPSPKSRSPKGAVKNKWPQPDLSVPEDPEVTQDSELLNLNCLFQNV